LFCAASDSRNATSSGDTSSAAPPTIGLFVGEAAMPVLVVAKVATSTSWIT
jgi:hypothetical protein